ncbi:molybdopterin-dependent oxidoreductase [Amaricoccus sp.]|uniref:molybdopterin-dependent oxidoreductase n=1 Tax=Amaricoccus sp. TaxID=1872485 RepID=UPI001B67734E|nr:molybdopterin-dependent oxidoreductase [Amaricoccus sp.]MBP7003330.1 hypothetical protein [Amaricoccus sp.]
MTTGARRAAALALALLAALAIAVGLAPASPPPDAAPGPALLTVSGAVASPNRGPLDPASDRLFVLNEIAFDRARAFDAAALAALPQVAIRADFPRGGPVATFTGPKLADVLAAAGAEGATVTLHAIDGFALTLPVAELVDRAAVLATARDGAPLGIGGLGPAQLVFPRAERSDLAGMNDDWWIGEVFHIAVE